MSKLLDDLRNEQRHYEQSVHGEGRAESIKRIADHIEALESKLAKAVEALRVLYCDSYCEIQKCIRCRTLEEIGEQE